MYAKRALVCLIVCALLPMTAMGEEASQPKAEKNHRQHDLSVRGEQIAKALDQPMTLEFLDAPLMDVAAYLADYLEVPVLVDEKALADSGYGVDEPITLTVKEISLRSALNLMLRPRELTWVVVNDVLMFTTHEAAQEMTKVKVYPVADLVDPLIDNGQADYNSLIEVLVSTIDPSSWEEVGGMGSVMAVPNAHSLVIYQSLTSHEKIETLLNDLRKAKQAQTE